MKKSLKNKDKSFKLKKFGFTLVELLAVIVILGVLALITFPIIDGTIRNSKEKALASTIKSIEDAAYNYSVKNDIGYQTYYQKITLDELAKAGLLDNEIINPVTNNKMNGCVLYKWDEEYKQYEFKYDEECNITSKPINEIIMNQFPYLETTDNGCVTPTDSNYSYMGGCYIKGNPNNNYIWYSGFLWRIMGINADGTVRMITDENVTTIPWGASGTAENWDESYAKDWLNNYFYPRLKGKDIIKETTWCSEPTTDSSSARTTCESNLSTQTTHVGLMTLDEYNLSGGFSSYLKIGQYQWTMTPYSSSSAWYVYSNGSASNLVVSDADGLRAVINVNSDVTITAGNGTLGTSWSSETGPYILNEDKSIEITGKLNKKTTSGEYVMFAGKKYRIVDKDSNGNTKLILDGYYEEEEKVFSMKYSDTGSSKFERDKDIGGKLNGDVLNWIVNNSDIEKAKLVSDYNWHQNNFNHGQSYRISLDETSIPTTATVGLIKIGEILSSQSGSMLTKGYTIASSYSNVKIYWTITPNSNSRSWFIDNGYLFGVGATHIASNYSASLRPVIVVNSDVIITGGNGTWSNPYQI